MARVLKPPMPLEWSAGERTVFLAGSIEMGSAPDWQSRVEQGLADTSVVMLNPRRDDWDASWSQEASDPRFRQQVEWELAAQERADLIVMYFAPTTRAPITLLELGLFARTGRLLVCCPPGFWRKGNVDVVCQRYGVRTVDSLDTLVAEARRMQVLNPRNAFGGRGAHHPMPRPRTSGDGNRTRVAATKSAAHKRAA